MIRFDTVYNILEGKEQLALDIVLEGKEDYKPIKLPYELDALEPHIDSDTMNKHYNKHYKGYINKLNELTKSRVTLVELIKNVKDKNDKVRFNAGGAYNHQLFWQMMTPERTAPKGTFEEMLTRKYKSVDNFKEVFKEKALTIMGSGWCWLVLKDGKLDIVTTANQDNPLMDNLGTPVLGLDMWEHAFYLKNGPDKDKYINSFFKVVNWDYCNAVVVV